MKRQRRLIAGKGSFGSKTVGVIADESSQVERLMNEFEGHEMHETAFLQKYKEVLEKTDNPLVKLLVAPFTTIIIDPLPRTLRLLDHVKRFVVDFERRAKKCMSGTQYRRAR